MDAPRRPRLTLARMMAANAALALLLSAARFAFAELAALVKVLACAWCGFVVVLAINGVLDRAIGIQCPHCRRRSLRKLTLAFEISGYYQCSTCAARCKRRSRLSPWIDASGPADVPKYNRRSAAGHWLGYFPPSEADDSTCGTLLRGKRQRSASPPAHEAAHQGPTPQAESCAPGLH